MKALLKSCAICSFIAGTFAAGVAAGCYIHPSAFMVVLGLALMGEVSFLEWYYKRKKE